MKGKESLLDLQKEKIAAANQLVQKGQTVLKLMSKLPFIRLIGVSGAVAADNPSLDKNSYNDLDLFVITSHNTLWIIFLIERLITNGIRLFNKGNHFFCFNYVTDESFLEIHNKNFFTATEIQNLKVIADDGIYRDFLEDNRWQKKYYPGEKTIKSPTSRKKKNYLYYITMPFNYAFFVVFCMARGIKKGKWNMMMEFTSKFDPLQKCNFHRISNPKGGYQQAIQDRFENLFRSNFGQYYTKDLVSEFFPSESSSLFEKNSQAFAYEEAQHFSKYVKTADEKSIN